MSVGTPVAGSTYVSVWPPRRGLASSTTTLRPASFTATAVYVPDAPPPITHTSRSMIFVFAKAVREDNPAAAKPAAEYDRSFSTFLRRRRIMGDHSLVERVRGQVPRDSLRTLATL